jgi:hypothetical protein
MFLWVSIISTVVSFMIIFTFKEKPARPPGVTYSWSFMGQLPREYETSTKKALKLLAGNRDYMFAMVSGGTLVLFTYIIASVIGQIVYAFGVLDQYFVSVLGTWLNIMGVVGSVLSAIVVFKAQSRGYSHL